LFLGIDTSAYTTSVAVVDSGGGLQSDNRIVLPVPEGEQGLKQSTALFYHLQNLPELMRKTMAEVNPREIRALAVSSQPRPCPGSYMPVFLAGRHLAESLAAALQVPLLLTTHQEGHLAAGLWSANALELKNFLAVHLSGGTSEVLLVEAAPGPALEFKIEILGSSLDLHAGQLIDRVGVAMGLPFPAGPALESLARQAAGDEENKNREKPVIKSSVRGYNMSFSGAETAARKLLAQGVPAPEVARAVEHCLATTLEKVLRRAVVESGLKDILIVGGVAANSYIRQRLQQRLEHPAVGARLIFPQSRFSGDNAVGVSVIARSRYLI